MSMYTNQIVWFLSSYVIEISSLWLIMTAVKISNKIQVLFVGFKQYITTQFDSSTYSTLFIIFRSDQCIHSFYLLKSFSTTRISVECKYKSFLHKKLFIIPTAFFAAQLQSSLQFLYLRWIWNLHGR